MNKITICLILMTSSCFAYDASFQDKEIVRNYMLLKHSRSEGYFNDAEEKKFKRFEKEFLSLGDDVKKFWIYLELAQEVPDNGNFTASDLFLARAFHYYKDNKHKFSDDEKEVVENIFWKLAEREDLSHFLARDFEINLQTKNPRFSLSTHDKLKGRPEAERSIPGKSGSFEDVENFDTILLVLAPVLFLSLGVSVFLLKSNRE